MCKRMDDSGSHLVKWNKLDLEEIIIYFLLQMETKERHENVRNTIRKREEVGQEEQDYVG